MHHNLTLVVTAFSSRIESIDDSLPDIGNLVVTAPAKNTQHLQRLSVSLQKANQLLNGGILADVVKAKVPKRISAA